ncbi:MAG: phosphatidyl-myo-inositol alpha-mannosyltransferase [Actinomycetota bacterium]
MRLALTHAYTWPDVRRGAERYVHEVSNALAARGHKVTVLTSGWDGPPSDHGNGVRVIRLPRRHEYEPQHEHDFGHRLLWPLFRHRFDAVHAFGPADARSVIRTAKGRSRRTVYMNLGIPYRWFWEDRHDAEFHDFVVREVDVYGCMSRCALDVLAEEYGRPGTLMPGGVNTEEFRPAPERERRPTVLFSGALDQARKGAATLLRALPSVLRSVPDLQVWLSGPGDPAPLLSAAPAAVRSSVEVLPLGDPKGQAERYGRAWVTALPSKWESFGMVVVEALACGTPVAAGNHGALPELVQPGVTGTLCDPDDVNSVAASVLGALELASRPGIADACRTSVLRFDWQRGIAPDLERIYAGG